MDKKKRRPQDATLRNVRALKLKKRDADLEARVERLERQVYDLINSLEIALANMADEP